MIIFSSSQKASNCNCLASPHRMVCSYEWCVYAGRFYVKCMFALILHIICPITLTSTINLPQLLQAKTQGINSLCSTLDSNEVLKTTTTKRLEFFCSRTLIVGLKLRIQLLWSAAIPNFMLKLLFFALHITSHPVAIQTVPDATDTFIKKTFTSKIIVRAAVIGG